MEEKDEHKKIMDLFSLISKLYNIFQYLYIVTECDLSSPTVGINYQLYLNAIIYKLFINLIVAQTNLLHSSLDTPIQLENVKKWVGGVTSILFSSRSRLNRPYEFNSTRCV